MNIKLWMLAGLLLEVVLSARYIAVKNEMQFLEEVNKFEFALVCFLQTPELGKYSDKELRKDVKMLGKTLDAISDTQPYRHELKREVGFLLVNASKESTHPLIKKYKIEFDEMPQFLLFKDGKVVSSVPDTFAKLIGFVSKADLMAFIDDYFGKDLDDILEKKAEAAESDKEMQLARYTAYAACRYPYGAYAPYNAYGPYSWYGYNSYYRNVAYYIP